MIDFFVPGRPVPQGSAKAFAFKRKSGKLGVQIVTGAKDESTPLGGWRARIAQFASEAMAGRSPHAGPVAVSVGFSFCAPKSVRDPLQRPVSRRCGDIDKLVRAVLDGLTGVAFVDDTQVIMLDASKFYVGNPYRFIYGYEQGDSEGVSLKIYLLDSQGHDSDLREERP